MGTGLRVVDPNFFRSEGKGVLGGELGFSEGLLVAPLLFWSINDGRTMPFSLLRDRRLQISGRGGENPGFGLLVEPLFVDFGVWGSCFGSSLGGGDGTLSSWESISLNESFVAMLASSDE